jgi:putative MATE family efflux protein
MTLNKDNNSQETPINWPASPEGSSILPHIKQEPILTTIPISKAIFKLAGPAIVSMLLLMVFNLVDIWWVSRLGPESLAGVSAAAFILWALESMGTLASTGVTSMVAKFIGSNHTDNANKAANIGFYFSIVFALLLGISGLGFSSIMFSKMGLNGLAHTAANDYMCYIYVGLACIFTSMVVDAVFRGSGDTKTPLKIMSIAFTINAVIDPIFIFGIGPIPRMEAGGAAFATILSHTLITLWGIFILNKRFVSIRLKVKNPINFDFLWKIIKIGSPIAFSGVMFSGSYMVLTHIITRFNAEALAALGLGHRIEGVAYFTAVGFALSAQTLVGQNLGAQKPNRASRAAWLSTLYICILLAVISFCFYFYPKAILKIFTSDPEVLEQGVAYLKIIALFEIFMGFEIVLEGAFAGAGNSLPPMLVIVPLTWARIPLSILFTSEFHLGINGIWLSIGTTTALKGLVLAFLFYRGNWKNK